MSKFNFDSEFFRKVISKCEKTEKISSLFWMVKEAVETFYDEYDYYPDLAVCAPGAFTIMGDHLEYVKGNLVQAALPLSTVVVGKSLCSVKCKLFTSSKYVEGLKKSIFPISHYKKNLKVFPEWVNYIKGIINCFPQEDIKGFDAVIHSNVPVGQGYGSSAALQVGFYTFLEAVTGQKSCEKKETKGNLCYMSEAKLELCEKKLGRFNNFTSALASPSGLVKINCRTKEVSKFDMRDINILFLLTYPNFEIGPCDRDYVDWRKMELHLAAKLLGLAEIIDATEYHLNVLENMEDPTKEQVIEILQELEMKEDCIKEFVEELFYFPKPESIPEDYGENFSEIGNKDVLLRSEDQDVESEKYREIAEDLKEKVLITPCGGLESKETWIPKPPPVSYIQQRIAELCAGKVDSQTILPQRICEEINCLGGIDNLSAASDLTVCGKLLRRVRHIVTENIRSLALSDLTSQVDYEEFGTKLIQSHLSLKIDYEVSCPVLDSLVQLAIDSEKVYGAKMTSGGGTLTLLHRSAVEKFIKSVIEKFGESFQFYLVFPSSGARILNLGIKNNPKSTLSDVFLNRDQLLKKAVEHFEAVYKYKPTHGAYSPLTINLIGDCTDYNHGFSLSIALNMMTVVVGALNGTTKIRAVTTSEVDNEIQKVVFPLPEFRDLMSGKVRWGKLIKGVVAHFKGLLKGLDCLIESSFPCLANVSSENALVMSFYTFLEVLNGERNISAAEKAHRCMLAVQEFTNILCGISELVVATRSKENFVVLVDCRTTSTTLIPFQDPSVTLLLTFVEMKTKSKRSLIYKRLEECYEVAKALGARTLRCLTLKELERGVEMSKKKIPPKSVRRAIHVLTENERVLKASEALKNHDFDTFGELMVASHNSLRDNYEISNPELDGLITSAMEVDGVLGSKMICCETLTCTISLVKRWATDDLIEYLRNSTSCKLSFYVVNPNDGCDELDLKEYLDKVPSSQNVFENIFPF